MKTLHTCSSSNTALTLFLRNKMKSHMKISFHSLARSTCTAQIPRRQTFYFTKKEIETGKALRPFFTKSKSEAFSLLLSIYLHHIENQDDRIINVQYFQR